MSKNKGTFILERFFKLTYKSELVPSSYSSAIIRPCDTPYSILRDVLSGTSFKGEIIFKGGVEFYRPEETRMSFHEWLVDISLNKNIIPDFEKHICSIEAEDPPWGKEHIMMEKDLHTGEILYVHPNFKDWPARVNKLLET